MIKNVIFDMGQVLVRWAPMELAALFAGDAEERDAICQAIFMHPDWAAQDAGAISEEEMRAHILSRLPEKYHASALRCYGEYERHAPEIGETHRLAEELKKQGRGVYVLSNASERFWGELARRESFRKFDGILISALEKMVKPDERIYRLMLERFGLKAEECVFVDDVEANVEGARAVGMAAIRFDGDVNRLRAALAALGAIDA